METISVEQERDGRQQLWVGDDCLNVDLSADELRLLRLLDTHCTLNMQWEEDEEEDPPVQEEFVFPEVEWNKAFGNQPLEDTDVTEPQPKIEELLANLAARLQRLEDSYYNRGSVHPREITPWSVPVHPSYNPTGVPWWDISTAQVRLGITNNTGDGLHHE